jgi:hypothetical protein
VKKPERLLRRLFQAAVEIHQENVAEGHRFGFPWLWQFPQASPSEPFFLFCYFFLSLWKSEGVHNTFSGQDRL